MGHAQSLAIIGPSQEGIHEGSNPAAINDWKSDFQSAPVSHCTEMVRLW